MSSPYTNTKRRRRSSSKPTKLQKALKAFAYLAAAAASIAAILSTVNYIRSRNTHTDAESLTQHRSLSELCQPEVFLEAYLAENSGETGLEDIQSIRVSGTIHSNERKDPFVLIKKRPGKLLFIIDRDSHEITFGANEEGVWQRIRAPKGEDRYTRIQGIEAKAWLEQRPFFDRIISATLGQGSIRNIEIGQWQGDDCLKVTTTSSEGKAFQLLVDPATLKLMVERTTQADGAVRETRFQDYRDINGVPVAFELETSLGSTVVNRISLKSATINSGVISRLFEMPDELVVE